MSPETNPMSENSAKLAIALNEALTDRNTVTIKEFNRFRPLFTVGGNKEVGAKEYFAIASEWQRRISIFHKIDIVANFPNGDGTYDILFTLPPMFVHVDPINKATDKSNQIISMFDGAMTRNHPLRTDKEQALSLMQKCVAAAQDQERVKDNVAEYTTLMKKLNSTQKSGSLGESTGTTDEPKDDSKADTSVIDDWS